jgi:hypothetical protein
LQDCQYYASLLLLVLEVLLFYSVHACHFVITDYNLCAVINPSLRSKFFLIVCFFGGSIALVHSEF